MIRRIKLGAALALIVGAMVSTPAFAMTKTSTEVDATISCLQSNFICELGDVSSIDIDVDENLLSSAELKVVVAEVDRDSETGLDVGMLFEELKINNVNSVIVYDNGVVVSDAIQSNEAAMEAYAGASNNPSEIITVLAEAIQYAGAPQPAVNSDANFEAGSIVLFVAVALGLIAAGGVMLFLKHRRKLKGRSSSMKTQKIDLSLLVTDELKEAMQHFVEATKKLSAHGDPMSDKLHAVSVHMQDLFRRLSKRGGNQTAVAAVEYTDTLKRLTVALGEDYYQDIKANPELWESPEERLGEIARAVQEVDKQLVENIKRVNSSRDLDFRSGIDELSSTLEHMDDPRAMLGG